MAKFDYDLVTVGAGSGGIRASRLSSRYGAKVAVCEESRVGGTCVIRGCVPKKLLVYGAHFADDFEDAVGFGWSLDRPGFDWNKLISCKDAEINRLNKVHERVLKDSQVDLLNGKGVVTDPHTVEIGGRAVTAANILIATGSWPHMPDIPGIKHAITSNQALELTELPKRMAIVGAGYIAIEFASIFAALGVEVTEIIRGDMVLRGFDEDIRAGLGEEMLKRGIKLHVKTQVKDIERTPDGGYALHLDHGEIIKTDLVMYATGRRPKTADIGLKEVGVKMNSKNAVVTDEFFQSSVPSIYAVGDATDKINLTPVALAEGAAFASTLFGGNPQKANYENIPTAVFSQPPIGVCGLTEADARARYDDVDIYVSRFKPMKHTLSGRNEQTLMKLVVDAATDRVVGCHMMGMDAAEIIQGFSVAMTCGARKSDFDSTIGVHPSAAEEFVTMREKRPKT